MLTIKQSYEIAIGDSPLRLSIEATSRIRKCREYLSQRIADSEESIYGINTGFGHLYNTSIPKNQLQQLQRNLLLSHACGMGEVVPKDIIRLMLFLKVQSLSYGHSGVQVATVQRLVDFFNQRILPVVYQQGSLGASGDLAPLSHLALPLIGEGSVYHQGKKKNVGRLMKQLKMSPIKLGPKEGLALINGTQFMSAYAVWCLHWGKYYATVADLLATMSLEAFDGRPEPFDPLVHKIRKQKGQKKVAKRIRKWLKGSELIGQEKKHVQDPYSFRCVPQVHGASLDAIKHVEKIVTREINAVTDNPNIFVEENRIISAGNFHGQPLALGLDYLAIALAELGSISERRTYKLINGERGLPSSLIENAGINSGLMIPQYTAASIVSQNKQLCSPASIDSIVSSKGQEDHVSMGANSATKCYRIVKNLEKILAIELMTAAQGLTMRKEQSNAKSSPIIEKLLAAFRKKVPILKQDRNLHNDMQKAVLFVRNEIPALLAAAESKDIKKEALK